MVVFPSGISVTISEVKESLSIVLALPAAFKNSTKGLLGTWNDNPDDDFLRPDGVTLPSNANGREIHFNFGLHWQVLSNTSLFTYKHGEDTSTFSNASFIPVFLEEYSFGNNTLEQMANDTCKGDVNCMFDIASTRDVSIGESTRKVAERLTVDSEELHNFPPEILSGPTEVNVTVNTTANLTVTAEDPNNDPMTFNVIGSLPKGSQIVTTSSSVTLTWNVTADEIDVEFVVADDSNHTAVLRPVIYVCACHNSGHCTALDENDPNNQAKNTGGRFNFLPCVCQEGYTGAFCEEDLDACEENLQPCYPGVKCIDLPPPANESGYKCGSCPNGFTGNGAECTDLNECAVKNGDCMHTCVNTPGSFVCTCKHGYHLNTDKKSCDDVDECLPVSDCMHKCENTIGGYNCKCNAHFEVDPKDPKNCIPKQPCGENSDCEQICYVDDTKEAKCACRAGYELQEDKKTCKDIDECAIDRNRCRHKCINTIGGYNCSCVDGFTLDNDGFTCDDIDECMAGTFNCSDEFQQCKNTYGSYKCVCEQGLYWINDHCKGLEKGATPPPPPPAPIPRTPSSEERQQSVKLEIQSLNTSQWNHPLEESFKIAVAEAATRYCSTARNCQKTSARNRQKRAVDFVKFAEDQVHILPGYPKQISENPLLARLAFYLQFPDGSSAAVVKGDVLVAIVTDYLDEISKSINKNITSVHTLLTKITTTTATATVPTEKEETDIKRYIIAGCVAGVVVFLVLFVLIAWRCTVRRRPSSDRRRVPGGNQAPTQMGTDLVESYTNATYAGYNTRL